MKFKEMNEIKDSIDAGIVNDLNGLVVSLRKIISDYEAGKNVKNALKDFKYGLSLIKL